MKVETKKTIYKIIVTVVSSVIALTPTWITILLFKLLKPETFWQKTILLGGCGFFLSAIQIVLSLTTA